MLTLVVIAQRKTALVGQRQMTGELVHGIEYFANQFLKPLGKARPIKFFRCAFFRRSKVVNTATGVLEAAP